MGIRVDLEKSQTGFQSKNSPSGLMGFVGWKRLETILRTAGELGDNEAVESFYVDETGLYFSIKKKK